MVGVSIVVFGVGDLTPLINPPHTQTHLHKANPLPHHLPCQSQPHCTVACPSLSPLQKHRERRRSSTAINGFPGNFNPFPGNGNLPDLVQQSTSPLISPSDGAQVCGAALPHLIPVDRNFVTR